MKAYCSFKAKKHFKKSVWYNFTVTPVVCPSNTYPISIKLYYKINAISFHCYKSAMLACELTLQEHTDVNKIKIVGNLYSFAR